MSDFFNINFEVRADLVIIFNLVKRLFEWILPNDPTVNNNPTRMKPIFFKAPKALCNTYIFTPWQQPMYNFVMKRIKGKRTGVQPLYHQKSSLIKANSFSTLTTFENTGAQFECISIWLISLSKKHRNTYSQYDAEMANYVIRKITISNLKISVITICHLVYTIWMNLTIKLNFTGNTWCKNIDFSNNKEGQNATSWQRFFTNQASKQLYIDLRDSLGLTGKMDPLKKIMMILR